MLWHGKRIFSQPFVLGSVLGAKSSAVSQRGKYLEQIKLFVAARHTGEASPFFMYSPSK
jgi:hypothetical protein